MPSCPDCGQEVRLAREAEDGSLLTLDTKPVVGGKYRLVADEAMHAERTEHAGQQGYMPHEETCPQR